MLMLSTLFILTCLVVNSERILKQSQCLFRHGSRLPNQASIIPNFFDPNEFIGDMTDNGEAQITALGNYWKKKLVDDNNLLTGNYELDDELTYFRTTIDRRVSQSMDAMLHRLYHGYAIGGVYTPQRVDDMTTAQYNCMTAEIENFYFRLNKSTFYLNEIFNASTRSDLITNVLFTSNFNLGYVNNLYDQMTCLREENETALAGNTKWETLIKYEQELTLFSTYNAIWALIYGYNKGNYANGYEFFKQIIDQMAIQVISNYGVSSLCRNGTCKSIFYSSQSNNIRMIAHQMGILTFDSIWVEVPSGSSLCFDTYFDTNNNQYSVDILFNEPILKTNVHNGNTKWTYNHEEIIHDVNDMNDSTTKNQSIISYACFDAPLASNCSISKMVEYLNNRKPNLNNDCCVRDNSEYVTQVFNVNFKCNNYTALDSQLNSNCVLWRDKCPRTACGNNQVYSPAFQTCVNMAVSS